MPDIYADKLTRTAREARRYDSDIPMLAKF